MDQQALAARIAELRAERTNVHTECVAKLASYDAVIAELEAWAARLAAPAVKDHEEQTPQAPPES